MLSKRQRTIQAQNHTSKRGMTYKNDDSAHASLSQFMEVVRESVKVDVIDSEISPLVHMINVRVLHILDTQNISCKFL